MGILKSLLTSASLKKLVVAALGFLATHYATTLFGGVDSAALATTIDTLGAAIAGGLAQALHLADPPVKS
jgi:hypothetical protein